MIREVNGSLLSGIEPYSVILHQVNYLGKMGAGLALQMAKKWPDMYEAYKNYCILFMPNSWDNRHHENELLGTWHRYDVGNNVIVCNAFCQRGISRKECVTDYDAWEKLLKKLEVQTRNVNKTRNQNWKIHCPYKMGCGLAGGDWDRMLEIIEHYFKDSEIEFIIHHY